MRFLLEGSTNTVYFSVLCAYKLNIKATFFTLFYFIFYLFIIISLFSTVSPNKAVLTRKSVTVKLEAGYECWF
jgi:hypothetical protein